MRPMTRERRIALVVSWNLAYCRSVLRGIRRFALDRPSWVLSPIDPQAGDDPMSVLRSLRPTGVIAHVYQPRLAAGLRRLGVPTVNVSGVLPATKLPRVGIDDVAVGRVVAEHLLDRGLRAFAFVGHAHHGYSIDRAAGFVETLARHGFEVQVYEHPTPGADRFDTQGRPWALDARVREWVARLPNPVGLLACNDMWGVQITEACRQLGLRVPEDVAIVGVDDDDLLCELARPSLSSVAVPGESIGFTAAEMLERMMRGRRTFTNASLLPPIGVIARQSSDLVATADAEVARAVRFIRDRLTHNVCVADVLVAVPVGRRSLERRFRAVIGRGIWEEIRRSRVESAKRLLADTTLSMPDVAARAGFTSAKQLSLVCRQELNTTPTAYRRMMSPALQRTRT